ncbi:MAG TPA: hypothetical protein VIR33_05915 [Thermopolyspora sp.]
MLWHAISPSRGYTKAANDLLRHQRLNSDAKVLILHVQGLTPGKQAEKALSEHARDLKITGRAYQKAKQLLVMNGFVHEWRDQGERGYWTTEQLFANVPLAREEAARVRAGRVAAAGEPGDVSPSVRNPTVGQPGTRMVGGYGPVDKELEKDSPHPPTEAALREQTEEVGRETQQPVCVSEPAAVVEVAPEAAEAERVLMSLRHSHRSLHLGVAEARKLVGLAVDWLRRGVSGAEMRRVLVSDLPLEGVRSAVGFLRHRLVVKMPGVPEVAGAAAVVPEPVAELVACAGPGDEHVFRAVGGETHCGPCRREAAWALHQRKWAADTDGEDDPYRHIPWRERFAALGT